MMSRSLRALVTIVAGACVAAGIGLTSSSASAVAPCSTGWVALTFDDGPVPTDTNPIIDILASHKVPATFFLVGQQLDASEDNKATARRAVSTGNRVENHTYTHPHLTQITAAQLNEEFTKTTNSMLAAGLPRPKLQRPPYGETNLTVERAGENLGLTQVLWNVDPRDWENPSAESPPQSGASRRSPEQHHRHPAERRLTRTRARRTARDHQRPAHRRVLPSPSWSRTPGWSPASAKIRLVAG
jgi:peptidoglycan/xylan/chitin deacetylase (PgdA/CDA1 family)